MVEASHANSHLFDHLVGLGQQYIVQPLDEHRLLRCKPLVCCGEHRVVIGHAHYKEQAEAPVLVKTPDLSLGRGRHTLCLRRGGEVSGVSRTRRLGDVQKPTVCLCLFQADNACLVIRVHFIDGSICSW